MIVETKSCKMLKDFYRFCNREFFNNQLPRTNKITLMWSGSLLEKDGSYGVFASQGLKRLGPYTTMQEAKAACRALNKFPKGTKFDKFWVREGQPKSIIPVPYILISSELRPFMKIWQKTLLHEMIHAYQHVKGLPEGHGQSFVQQSKRLLSIPKVRRNIL